MNVTKGNLAAAFLTMIYVVYAFINFVASQALAILVLSIIPLCLILFAEQLGDFQGYIPRAGNIDKKTHPAILVAIGWAILLVLMLFVLMK